MSDMKAAIEPSSDPSSRTFTVDAYRSRGWWALEIPSAQVFTQTRRLDTAEATAKDAIGLMLDVTPESIVIEDVKVHLTDDQERDLEEAQRRAHDADLAKHESRLAMSRLVTRMRNDHISLRDIAHILGLSHQRVAQLEAEARGSGGHD